MRWSSIACGNPCGGVCRRAIAMTARVIDAETLDYRLHAARLNCDIVPPSIA